MNSKYRVRLKSGRVVGPFVLAQLGELYIKNHIDGTEECQYFPVGDWKSIELYPEINELIGKIASKEITDQDLQSTNTHTVARLSAAQQAKKENEPSVPAPKLEDEDFQEFKFTKDEGPKIDYGELERKYIERKAEEEKNKKDEKQTQVQEEAPGVEKTVVIKRPVLEKVEKTVIVSKNDLAPLRKETPEDSADDFDFPNGDAPKEDAAESPPPPEPEDDFSPDEKTEFLNLDKMMTEIKVETKTAERELERRAIEEEKKYIDSQLIEYEDEDDEEEDSDKGKQKKKKLKPIYVVIIIAVLVLLMLPEEDKPKPIVPVYSEIPFPVAKEFIDELKSEDALTKAYELIAQGTYDGRLRALKFLNVSLEHKFRDNEAIGWYLRVAAEIFENSKDRVRNANNLFRLIQITKGRALSDENVLLGTATFYLKTGKTLTAQNLVENYLRVSKPSADIYTLYLEILMSVGRYDQAGKVRDTLLSLQKKPQRSYVIISKFFQIDQRYDRALEVINEGLEFYPDAVDLLLAKSSILMSAKRFNEMPPVLDMVFKYQAERSPVYFAKYIEYRGILAAAAGDSAKAIDAFNKAISINESDELRSLLAQAEVGGGQKAEKLILESQVIEKMGRVQEEVRKRNWDLALAFAIEAADLMPNYIPAQLLLAKIQRERGFYEPAIKNLERLKEEFPVTANINYALVLTYLHAHKIEDAETEIYVLAQTEFSQTAEYASLLAMFYEKTDSINQAIRFYNEAIKRNPIDDINYYNLAKIYLRYKKFEESKKLILDAIELDPSNVYYHSVYANILYEMQTPEVAIGYLRGILEQNSDHPKILGDIAIYYYRSGKIREFDEYRKRVEALNVRDESFYEFLIESSRLRRNDEEVISYSKELIRVNPGNLDVRMNLGEFLFKRGAFNEAIKEFEEVVERLSNYPRANYYLAKCYVALNKYDEALKFAELEIEGNSTLEHGYFIKGEILRLKQEYGESVKMLEKAISINQRSVEALLALGWIKFRQNFLDTARELYNRALKEDQSIPDVHLQLGHIYRLSGQGALAIDFYMTYLNLRPNAPDRQEIEQRIRSLRN